MSRDVSMAALSSFVLLRFRERVCLHLRFDCGLQEVGSGQTHCPFGALRFAIFAARHRLPAPSRNKAHSNSSLTLSNFYKLLIIKEQQILLIEKC